MKNYKDLPRSTIEITLQLLDSKWKVLIIKELLKGTMRFGELKKSVNGITQKVLAAKLRELENDEIIIRKAYEQNPPKVEYSLTDVGYSLRVVVNSLSEWGKDYKKYVKLLEKYNGKV